MIDPQAPSAASPFELAMSLGGGVIPESGNYSAEAWAAMLNVTARVFRGYVTKYSIPYREPGNTMFVDAQDFINAIPLKQKGAANG